MQNEPHYASMAARIPSSGDVLSVGALVKEEATGIAFPQLCKCDAFLQSFPSLSRIDPTVSMNASFIFANFPPGNAMRLCGCGVRVKYVFVKVSVFGC